MIRRAPASLRGSLQSKGMGQYRLVNTYACRTLGSSGSLGQQAQAHLVEAILTGEVGLK